MPEKEENPVASGLIALVAVAVVVGILGAIGVVVATRVLGLNEASDAAANSNGRAGDSFTMPDPVPTTAASDPLVTLIASDEESDVPSGSESESESEEAEDEESESEEPEEGEITLSQGAFEVGPGEQLYLSGIYPGGEGTVLDIQSRVEGGSWDDFPVDVNVANETFSTYVETYRTGTITWRVVDTANGIKSNEVRVRHTD